VLVIAPAPEGEAGEVDQAALDALAKLVDAGAKPRPAVSVVAELTGTSANALYRAFTAAGKSRK
jgi:16S rRNA (cytidine1402-2'-O)-methyltransferase